MKGRMVGIALLAAIVAAVTWGCTRDRESVQSATAAADYRGRFETLVIPDGTNVLRMTLAYEGIVDSEGVTRPLTALPLVLQAASTTAGDVKKIAAGTVLGAIVGGIAGGGDGAAIGAGAGAGAGVILVLATKGDEVELEPGQRLNVQMTSATSMQVMALR